jgi:diguanylate cyclase (GGDEF)-like protein
MVSLKNHSRQITFLALALIFLTGLTILAQRNFLFYHVIAELFSISIAFGIFMVTWNARDFMDNYYLLYVGVASLFIGIIDLFHVLSFTGMGIIPNVTADTPTQLWIAARAIQAVIFVVAPLLMRRKPNRAILILSYFALTSFFLLSIMVWKNFPVCFIEGVGLTPFKKITEYIISLILLGAIALLFYHHKAFDQYVFKMLVGSLIFTVISELLFTFYFSAMDRITVAGHLYKIIAFYYIYEAIIKTSVVHPQHIVYRNLVQSEENLRIAEARYRQLFNHMSSSVFVLQAVGGGEDFFVRDVNQSAQAFDQFNKEDVVDHLVTEVRSGVEKTEIFQILKQVYQTKHSIKRQDMYYIHGTGVKGWRDIYCYALPNDEIVLMFDDVTDRKNYLSQMEFMASHDLLTDLPNRSLYIDRLTHAIQLTRRIGSLITVFFIDLDNFKVVNDQYGHASGDMVLIEVAKRLTEMMRKSDTVARFSGDEFVILTELTNDREAIRNLAQKILDKIEQPIQVEEGSVTISASIGISISPDDGLDAEELLRKADTAMYVSKDNGLNKITLFQSL